MSDRRWIDCEDCECPECGSGEVCHQEDARGDFEHKCLCCGKRWVLDRSDS